MESIVRTCDYRNRSASPFQRQCTSLEVAMTPIDYFMAVFVGMCLGFAGLAYLVG